MIDELHNIVETARTLVAKHVELKEAWGFYGEDREITSLLDLLEVQVKAYSSLISGCHPCGIPSCHMGSICRQAYCNQLRASV